MMQAEFQKFYEVIVPQGNTVNMIRREKTNLKQKKERMAIYNAMNHQ